jgi:hypothetical protein
MPTPRFHILLTFITLVALAASCAPQSPRSPVLSPVEGLDPVSPTDSPATPASVQSPTAGPASQPSQPPAAIQKPSRGTKAPKGEPQGQGQGSDASQNLNFDIPAHPLDVILGRPTNNSITLSVFSATNQTLAVTYGTENTTPQTVSLSLTANTPREITLSNLTPDTQYYYTLSNGEKHTFHTARASGSTFTFTLQADSHLDSNTSPQVYQQTLANQRADRPDFAIDLGDTFMTDKYKPYTAAQPQYLAQRYFLSQIGQAAPLFLVLGNHDGEGAPKGNSGIEMSTWSAQLRAKLFPNPTPDAFYTGNATPDPAVGALQDYYAWEWGDALFVVLDPYWFTPPQRGATTDLWGPTLGEAQYRWLKNTLETSDAQWKFVFIHQLIGGYDKNGRGGIEVANFYEWGGNNADGSYGFDAQRPGWGIPIHQLLVQNHVNAVFHGHDHLFVKQELDGIIYQEIPQPSASRANATNSASEYGYLSGDVLGSPGHLRVTVTPSGVTVDYVRAYLPQDEKSGQQNRQVDYSYTIK